MSTNSLYQHCVFEFYRSRGRQTGYVRWKAHNSNLISRMIRAGLRRVNLRYRVIAAGIDDRNRIISIATNQPYLPSRGRHAEERVIYNSPRTLNRILLLRVNSRTTEIFKDQLDAVDLGIVAEDIDDPKMLADLRTLFDLLNKN